MSLFSSITNNDFMLSDIYNPETALIDSAKVFLLSQKNLSLNIFEKIDVLLSYVSIYAGNNYSYVIPLTIIDLLIEHYDLFDDDNSPIQNLILYRAIVLILNGFNTDITDKHKTEISNKFSLAIKENPKLKNRFNEFYHHVSTLNWGPYNDWYIAFITSIPPIVWRGI